MNSGWMIDEKHHAGQEHFDADEVARFDQKMPWDPSDDIEVLLELGLSAEDTVVDFGTGTGVFPLAVAEHCDRVVALDAGNFVYVPPRTIRRVVNPNDGDWEIVINFVGSGPPAVAVDGPEPAGR